MTPAQAGSLATTIAQTWPRISAVDIWEEELLPLDHGRAEEAYRRLRREAKHPPAIAEFLAAYRNLLGTAPPRDAGDYDCHSCQDWGWVTDTDHPRHGGYWAGREDRRPVLVTEAGPQQAECICGIVRPCACAVGQRAKEAHYGPRRHAA